MEKSFRGHKHICSNCNTKFFDFNKEKIICPNCKTEKVMQKKAPISAIDIKTEKEVKKVDDNLELSEEVEFDDDEINEVLEDDDNLDIAEFYGEQILLNSNIVNFKKLKNIYKKTTPKIINQLANEIFDFNKVTLIQVGNLGKSTFEKTYSKYFL